MSKKNKADSKGFVYSTDPGFRFQNDERELETLSPSQQLLKITNMSNCYKCRKLGHQKRECTSKSYNNNNKSYSYNSNKGKSKFNNLEEQPHASTSDNNNMELTNSEANQERLLHIIGKINRYFAQILLDSRVSRNFLDKNFVNCCNIIIKQSVIIY